MCTLAELAEEYKQQADKIKEQIDKLEREYDLSSQEVLFNTEIGRKYSTLREIHRDLIFTYWKLKNYYK